MNNENSYRHFSSLKSRENNMNIYRFFKYFPVTLKHLAHSPKKWSRSSKLRAGLKIMAPGSSVSANPLSRILKIYLS